MPNPTISDVHISSALTDISIAYSQRSLFRTREIFPTVPVMKQGDQYYVWDKGDLLRSMAQDRAPGTESAGGGVRLSTNTYYCNRTAYHNDIADPIRANADAALNLDVDATEHVTEQIELEMELDWTTNFFTTGVWDGASSSTDMTGQAAPASTASNFLQWNDAASTPIEDIEGEASAIAQNNGLRPNTLVVGANTWVRGLKNHPDILDRIKYTQTGIVSPDLVASLLDLERVIVLWGTRNTAQEQQADSYSYLAGEAALLCYVTPRPGLRAPTAGYRFVWTGGTGVPAQGVRMKRFRMEHVESDRIEGETWYDHQVVASNLGAYFASAVA